MWGSNQAGRAGGCALLLRQLPETGLGHLASPGDLGAHEGHRVQLESTTATGVARHRQEEGKNQEVGGPGGMPPLRDSSEARCNAGRACR